jgi:hypothetical protein
MKKLHVQTLCAFCLITACIAESEKHYASLVMPENVALGMSSEAFRPIRLKAKKLDHAVGSMNTNATVLTEVQTTSSPSTCYQYHFVTNILCAVTRSTLHAGKKDKKEIADVTELLRKNLKKGAVEKIVRFDERMNQILVDAELWQDDITGTCVYFVDAPNELTIITFDPKYFKRKDFFITADELPQIAPALKAAKKVIEESTKIKQEPNTTK